MSWLTAWPESIKKRACRYLLQHYLGQFLQEKLRLDQLSVDLYNGTGHVNNVALDIWSLNAMLDQAHVPMELVDGYIGSIEVSIPWSALLKDNCKVEIKGLEIILQPKYRTDADLGDVTDSLYRSLGNMTTSMQLAEGCLKEDENETQNDSSPGGLFEGLEVFAQTIETVLSRVKVSLTDMVVRVEYLSESSKNGIALEMHIDRIDYFDEITMEDKSETSSTRNNAKSPNPSGDKKPVFQKDSITCKRFQASGVSIYLDEFPEHLRTSPQGSPQDGSSSPIDIKTDIPEFQTMTADPEQEFGKPNAEDMKTDGPILIGKFFGTHEVKLRIRQNEHVTAPKIDAECYLGSCGMFLTPHQVHLLAEFTNGIAAPVSTNPARPQGDEFTSLQTNNFATCTEGIKLSPNVGSYQHDAMEEMRKHKEQINKELNTPYNPYSDVDGEQFFSMEGPLPSEYGTSEYGTSIYSESTGYTPSSYTNRSRASRITSMNPASKLMGGGHRHFGDGKYSFSPSSPPREYRRQSSGRDDEKSIANHCRYQLQIRALALTILHINPLPGATSPTHCHNNAGLDSDSSTTPQPSTGSDVDISISTICSDKSSDVKSCHKEMSEKYFCTCETVLDEILKSDKNISSVRNDLASVCFPHDHLRFSAAHIHLNTELKASHSLNTELSFGKAEITECVFADPPPPKPRTPQKGNRNKCSPKPGKKRAIHSEILVFDANSDIRPGTVNSDPHGVSSPNIRIHVSSHETSRSAKTSLHVHLSACESEVDISIVDRISTLLYPPENQPKIPSTTVSLFSPTSCYTHSNPDAFSRQAAFNEALTDDTKERQLHFNVSASFLRINFRFPIADLRPEMERRPWYARSLRDETLILEAYDIAFLTSSLGTNGQSGGTRTSWHSPSPPRIQQRQEFEITVKDLHVLYSDEPDKPKSFLRISQSPADMEPLGGPTDANSDLDCPHIKVTINPAQEGNNNLLLQESATLSEHQSPGNSRKNLDENNGLWFDEDFPLDGSQEATCNGNPSPFSQRKVIYNNKEMILPGDSTEISNFSEHAISTSLVSISIQLPAVNAFLVSKSFFENLYNRINNDILLWAPAAPKPHSKIKSWVDSRTISHLGDSHFQFREKGLDIASQLLVNNDDKEDSFSSDSDSEDDVSTNYSRPSLLGASRRVVKSVNENSPSRQSLISISTKIGYGSVSAKCNVLRPDGMISHAEHGEVVIMLENANIFNVASYCGNPLLDYVCIQIANFNLYHKASIPSLSSFHPAIERLTVEAPSHLDKVITRCEEGISRTFGKNANESQNMLVLAIKIETEDDRPMKQCLIAAGVNAAMLHHRFAKTGYSWLEQIIDFVDATDDDVLGYKPPSFITEIHLNVKNSAAVYKPLYMAPPVSAVLTASSFTLSSNIVAGAAVSILDIIIDEAKLYITDQHDASCIDLLFDYACVLDVNFFEVCLKLSNQFQNSDPVKTMSDFYPLIDLQASNNMIMLRTCADSCTALGALVRYLADDGDLATGGQDDDDDDDSASDYQSQVDSGTSGWTDHESPLMDAEDENLENEEGDDDDDDLADLMADAMEDIFEDAPSEFGAFGKKTVSAMTESMYNFSTAGAISNPRRGKDVMSQSVMIPSNHKNKHVYVGKNSHVFSRREGQDLYYSAFHKHGICRHSEAPSDDDFLIIDDDLETSHHASEPEITYRSSDDDAEDAKHIQIVDNHFKPTYGKIDQLRPPEHFPVPVFRYTLKEMSCIWCMYGGSDFKTTDTPSRKNSASGLQTSPMRGQSSPIQLKHSAKKRNVSIGKQGSSRDSTMLMEVHLTKVRAQFEQYPDDTMEASRTVLMVSDFEVRDKLQSSNINKFLYRFHSEASPRQAHAKALLVKVLQIRPEGPGTPTESRLRISLQPLRLNVDQDTLNFLTKFFGDVSSSTEENGSPSRWMAPASNYETAVGSPSSVQNRGSPKNLGTPYSSPVMTRPKSSNNLSGQNTVLGTSPADLRNGSSPSIKSASSSGKSVTSGPSLQPTFFREVVFSPEVPIRLDYHGKRIDTEQGTISGLLMGLGQLNCSQLKLKRVVHRHGLLGVDKLITFLLNEWAADIRANQLPLILGGVGPMHSVVQLFKGVRDLVYLPVEQYRKDGRIVRGLQRGATSFGTSTAMATLEITNRAIGLIQSAAETTYELVSPPDLHRRELQAQRNWRTLGSHAKHRQPVDIREGMSNALTVVKHGVEDTAGQFVRVVQKEHERTGVTGAVGGVLRHIPPALVRPVIMATEATTNVLSGIRNQIQPDAKQQDEDKWKVLNEDELS